MYLMLRYAFESARATQIWALQELDTTPKVSICVVTTAVLSESLYKVPKDYRGDAVGGRAFWTLTFSSGFMRL